MSRVAIGCTLAVAAIIALRPSTAIMELDDLREGQLEAAAALTTSVAGAVVLGRFRRSGSQVDLILAAGLLLLALQNLFSAVAIPTVDALGASRVATWAVTPLAALGAIVIAVAAWAPDRLVVRRRRAAYIAGAGAAVALVGAVSASRGLAPHLDPVFETMPVTVDELWGADLHRGLLSALIVTAGAWAVAAVGLARRADRDDDALLTCFGYSATLAAAAFVLYAWFPSHLTEMLHGGDLLLLGALVTLLYGSVRQATRTEELLVRSAVTSERQRVAGELRAGVAQELALMAVQTERISGSSEQADALARSVERALVESSGAIASLGRPVDEPLADAVAHAARDAADRLGVLLHLHLDDHAVATREWREALARITREAVVMAVRHGGATSVSVELTAGRRPTLRVLHDGPRAISWDSTDDGAVATRALRERAAVLGGTLRSASSTAGERGFEVSIS